MRDLIDLGCAPNCEDCAQVGSEDYFDRARRECRAYIRQLRRMFGEEPEGARLSIRPNPHDFGTYLSVTCYFDHGNQPSVDYAFKCEGQSPHLWDEEAQWELSISQRSNPRKEPANE